MDSDNIEILDYCYNELRQPEINGSLFKDYLFLLANYKTGRIDEYMALKKEFVQNKKAARDPVLFQLLRQLPKGTNEGIGPVMVLDSNVVDMGKVKIGEEISKQVHIHNAGDADLIMFHPIVSCSCVSIVPKRVIKSGECSPCEVKMTPKGPVGQFIIETMIVSNADNKAEQLLIKGEQL